MKKWLYFIGIFVFVGCSEEVIDEPETEITVPETETYRDVINHLPNYVLADFSTFDLAFWGSETIESNRNYDVFKDSIYLTIGGSIDSIEIFKMRGVEDFYLTQQAEGSIRISSPDSSELTFVDWKHWYSTIDTLDRTKFKFWNKPTEMLEAKISYTDEELMAAIVDYEEEYGAKLWSTHPSVLESAKVVHSRSIYRASVLFNNGEQRNYSVVLQHVNR